MADLNTHYDVAVIDECQMIADWDRGGAWTAAILGLCADVSAYVHSSNIAGPYRLEEDYEKRLGPQKYPNGALRGIVIVPDWPKNEDVELSSLRLAHVSDSIVVNEKIDIPSSMRVEGYVCNGCKDVFIRHLANVRINTLL